MITIQAAPGASSRRRRRVGEDEAQVAAAAFLARYSGRTLEAYRQDLRVSSNGRATRPRRPGATRPHIELYRRHDQRGLAPRRSTDG